VVNGPARRSVALLAAAIFLFFLAVVSGDNFVDPDLYHLLALIREALRIGHIPIEDRFAYTPTVHPCIHHEWGTGALLYAATSAFGAGGIPAWKYALAALLGGTVFAVHRRESTPIAVVALLAPAAIVLVASGFSTLRAQVFTLLCVALLMLFLDRDRRGERGWILPWLLLHVVWVNLHAGFVVGTILFGLHAVEQRLRGARVGHLVATLAAMALLVLANPYGWTYVPALLRALTLDRSIVTEWDPIWKDAPAVVAVFAGALALAAYGGLRGGWRNAPGALLVLAAACGACLHQRHASIFGVVWICLVPRWIARTPLAVVSSFRPRFQLAAGVLVAAASAFVVVRREPWRLRVPANPGEEPDLRYPAGAVAYLAERRFEGNVMVPFTVGAFVSWELHPRVRVSFDSRLEAAYPPGAAAENRDFYAARDGWRATLARYPTDAVLAPAESRVADALLADGAWSASYRDDAYALFVRPGLSLDAVDRRGARIPARFP
jgi:hypothetical protein